MNCEEVKNIIINSFNEKKNSHAFLLVTNNIEKCYLDVIEIIRRINCQNGGDANCECNICNTIRSNNNPDLISIFPDGKEIKKDQILDVIRNFSTKPLLNKYSSYVIVNADKMNSFTANKILKFLEEPEENIIGFFITDQLLEIIPTIKSRCEIYHYKFGETNVLDVLEITKEDYNNYFDYAMNLVEKMNDSPKYILMNETKNFAKKERFEIEKILNIMRKVYEIKFEFLTVNKYNKYEFVEQLIKSISTDDIKVIVKRINILDNIINDFKMNVNKELFINKLFLCWE